MEIQSKRLNQRGMILEAEFTAPTDGFLTITANYDLVGHPGGGTAGGNNGVVQLGLAELQKLIDAILPGADNSSSEPLPISDIQQAINEGFPYAFMAGYIDGRLAFEKHDRKFTAFQPGWNPTLELKANQKIVVKASFFNINADPVASARVRQSRDGCLLVLRFEPR